jgi:hypothetical protein
MDTPPSMLCLDGIFQLGGIMEMTENSMQNQEQERLTVKHLELEM